MCRPGARAGEGEASAGVAAGGAEGSERGAGGRAADDGGRQAEAGGQHAGSAHTVRERHPGKTARSRNDNIIHSGHNSEPRCQSKWFCIHSLNVPQGTSYS